MSKITPTSVTEVRSLTGLRGVAALYVVIFHSFTPYVFTNSALCFLAHGYLAVDLFFTLSGFVMALNYSKMFSSGVSLPSYRTFLLRRIARIYPLYLLTTLVAAFLVAHHLLHFEGASLTIAFWTNVFLAQNWGFWVSLDAPSWSISAEWFAYLCFPLLLQLVLFRGVRAAQSVFMVCLVSLGGLYLFSLHTLGWPSVFDRTRGPASLVRCLPEFSLGMLAFRCRTTRLAQRLINLRGAAETLVVICILLLAVKGTDLILTIFFPLLILSLLNRETYVSRILGSRAIEYLGLLSFSIYLLQVLFNPVLDRVDGFVRRLGWAHAHTYAVAAILPILLLTAAFTYHFVEVPGRRILRNWLEPNARKVTIGP